MAKLYVITNCLDRFRSLLIPIIDGKIVYRIITNEQELNYTEKNVKNDDILFSYSHSIVLNKRILEKFKLAVNVHAGPPSYPGRDIQHFAVYNGVTEYGATLHMMTEKVDSGEILDVEMFAVKEEINPIELHRLANDAAFKLISRNLPKIISGKKLVPIGIRWGEKKYTRKDFIEMCTISHSMSNEEIDKRIKIFTVPGYQNIRTNIRGYWFYYKNESI